jgi:serine protease Do
MTSQAAPGKGGAFRRASWLVALLLAPALGAQVTSPGATSEVFRRFSDRVLKVEVVETSSAAKASLGSAFFVNSAGDLVTNFHVISQVVHFPDRYRLVWVDRRGASHPATVLAIDVISDLAMLRTGTPVPVWLELSTSALPKGERLFSLGNPHDLGLSIVEGTYNGNLEHTLYDKIHITAPLNPGMSGGPTVSEDGRVVGVNVSTAGEEVSFLVPAERVARLVAAPLAAGSRAPAAFLKDAGAQIRAYQNIYLAQLFAGTVKTVRLGPFEAPTDPAPFFNCWADADQPKDRPYSSVRHYCSTDDYLFLSGEQSSGIITLTHHLITSAQLNRFRFATLYSQIFSADFGMQDASAEEMTSFRCETRNVRNEKLHLRAVLCLRRYRKLDGLYDAVVKLGTLGASDAALVTTLSLAGVSVENVQRLADRLIRSITWRP